MELDFTRVLNGGNTTRQVCDNCKFLKKRCDRALPKCSNCVKRKIECTRDIVSHKHKGKKEKETSYNQGVIIIGKHSKDTKAIKKNKMDSVKVVKKQKNEIHLLPNNFLMMSSDLETFKKTTFNINSRHLGIYPFKLFHIDDYFDKAFSHIYQSNPKLRVYLALKSYKKLKGTNLLTNSQAFQNCFQQKMVHDAYHAYFRYINLELPLFTFNGFVKSNRCYTLRLAVLLSGLSLLPQASYINHFANYIKGILIKELSPSKIQLNLGYIQSLLVLKNGLRGHPFALPSYLYSDIIHLCILLGLHIKCPNTISFDASFERHLAISAAVYLDTNSNMFAEYKLNYIYSLFNNNCIWDEPYIRNIFKTENEPFYIKNFLILARYRLKLSHSLRSTYSFLSKIGKMELKSSQVYSMAKKCFHSIDNNVKKSTEKLHSLVKGYKQYNNIIKYVETQIILVLTESNTAVMHLCETMGNSKILDPNSIYVQKPVTQKPENLEPLISYGKRIISYNKTLGLGPYASTRIIGLIYALRTLQVYAPYHDEASEIIKQGFECLENLKKVNNYTWVIESTLDLTRVVVEIDSKAN